jgi:4-hydroxybenzoate polyprenyltransferase
LEGLTGTTTLRRPDVKHYITLLRPKQWLKNFFVFAPLIFARQLFDGEPLLSSLKAFAAFCLAASAVYIINAASDIEADRAHPEKKNRPLAAGTVSHAGAGIVLACLLIITGVILSTMDVRFSALLIFYFLLNLAYSFKLKEVVLLDVFIVAGGFMLRVLGGAYAIGVKVSSWIVLCSLFISLFLGFAKRRGELVQAQAAGAQTRRKVLLLYRVDFIDQMLTIAAAGAVISYALYTVAPRTVEQFHTERLIYTTVFVIYGVFRYLYLIHTTPTIENPTNAVTSDPTIIVTGLLWIATCIAVIYSGGNLPV